MPYCITDIIIGRVRMVRTTVRSIVSEHGMNRTWREEFDGWTISETVRP